MVRMSLWMACNQNEVDLVKQILARETVDINHPSTDGSPPLWIASQNGHINTVRTLLANKFIDPNAQHTKKGTSPLFAAVASGHLEIGADNFYSGH